MSIYITYLKKSCVYLVIKIVWCLFTLHLFYLWICILVILDHLLVSL